LKSLQISQNRLTAIDPQLFAVRTLESLNLSGNKIKELPAEIGQLMKLKKLLLGKNQLQRLPPEIGGLKKLELLAFEGNQLEVLPTEMGGLSNLAELDLDDNRLREIPETLADLGDLRVLKLKHNQLTGFPAVILKRTQIARIEIDGNPFPMEKFKELEGFEEVRNDFSCCTLFFSLSLLNIFCPFSVNSINSAGRLWQTKPFTGVLITGSLTSDSRTEERKIPFNNRSFFPSLSISSHTPKSVLYPSYAAKVMEAEGMMERSLGASPRKKPRIPSSLKMAVAISSIPLRDTGGMWLRFPCI